MTGHVPVLLDRVVEFLDPRPGRTIVDGTVGGGGHAEALLERGATVIGVDRDAAAIEHARARLGRFGDRFRTVRASFADFEAIFGQTERPQADGFLLDLGISSLQLDDPSRGFAFSSDGPLDMRMDVRDPRTAGDLLNALDEGELADLFRRYGEERRARRIARAIVRARKERRGAPWKTRELVDLILRAAPRQPRSRVHPATRVFQALRIAVNRELDHLSAFLQAFDNYLREGGRVVVVSFHSLEDRLVKTAFRAKERAGRLRVLTRKPVRPDAAEIAANPRARSARLRAASRIGEPACTEPPAPSSPASRSC